MPVPFINIYPRKLRLQKNTNSVSADLHARGRSVWHAAEYWIKSKKINTASVLPLIQLALICLYSLCICVPTAFPSVLIYVMKFLGHRHKCDGHSVNYHNNKYFTTSRFHPQTQYEQTDVVVTRLMRTDRNKPKQQTVRCWRWMSLILYLSWTHLIQVIKSRARGRDSWKTR